MTSTKPTTLQGAAGPVLDLTPGMTHNWLPDESASVLIVNPVATLHQRCALAWAMSREAHAIADSVASAQDAQDAVSIVPVLATRLHQLETLLCNISEVTRDAERD